MCRIIFSLWLGLVSLLGQAAEAQNKAALKVAIWEVAPFAMRNAQGRWEGIAVDLWEACAQAHGWNFEYLVTDPTNVHRLLVSREVELVVPPMRVTADRERQFDFSHFYYSSGVGVAVRSSSALPWGELLRHFMSRTFAALLGSVLLILVVAGSALWWVERKGNPDQFGGPPREGVGAGIWWAAVTLTTVGYGDKAPKTLAGRAIGILWMFAGFFILAGFTAHVSSLLTEGRMRSHVHNLNDLARSKVGAVSNSYAFPFVQQARIRRRLYAGLDQAMKGLERREVDAVVEEEATLRYALARNRDAELIILPFMLTNDPCAFGLSDRSAIRESLDQTLLDLRETGFVNRVVAKYLE